MRPITLRESDLRELNDIKQMEKDISLIRKESKRKTSQVLWVVVIATILLLAGIIWPWLISP